MPHSERSESWVIVAILSIDALHGIVDCLSYLGVEVLYFLLEALLFVGDIQLVQAFAVDLVLQASPAHLFYLSLAEITRYEILHEGTFPFDFLLLQRELALAEIESELLILTISRWSIADV